MITENQASGMLCSRTFIAKIQTNKAIKQDSTTHKPSTKSSSSSIVQENSRKEGNVLFTFYLRLYGGTHMVKDHSYSERKPATWATLSD